MKYTSQELLHTDKEAWCIIVKTNPNLSKIRDCFLKQNSDLGEPFPPTL